MKAIWILIAVGLGIGAGVAYPAWDRAHDWKQVDQALARLKASAENEPVMMLRSRMAELDLALEEYRRSGSGIDRYSEGRVRHADAALWWLREVLGEPARNRRIKERDWAIYKVHKLGADEIERKCGRDGILYVDGPALKAAYIVAFQRELELAREGRALLPYVSYDLAANRMACAATNPKRR